MLTLTNFSLSLSFHLVPGQAPLSDHRRARPGRPPTPDPLHLLRAPAGVQGLLRGDGVGHHRRSEPREVLVLETQPTRPPGRVIGGGAGIRSHFVLESVLYLHERCYES